MRIFAELLVSTRVFIQTKNKVCSNSNSAGGHVSERDIHSEQQSTMTFKTIDSRGDRVHQWLDDHLFIHILK